MRFLLLIPVAVALVVGGLWAWQLVRHWSTPPAGWSESLGTYRFIGSLPPLTLWRFSIVSGIVGGLVAVAVGVLVLVG